jgi:hypothetical protein
MKSLGALKKFPLFRFSDSIPFSMSSTIALNRRFLAIVGFNSGRRVCKQAADGYRSRRPLAFGKPDQVQ